MKVNLGRFINREGHTRSSLPYFLRHDPKDREYLNHDLYNHVRHSCCRPDFDILFKPLKKKFQAAKQVYKSILASADILDGLRDRGVIETHTGSRKTLTWRRTPIPAKITFEGGNICSDTHQRVDFERLKVSQLPAQHRYQWSQRMRTRHLQWDPAT